MKRRLFNIAHSIKANFASFAQALAHAWKVIKLHQALSTKAAVNFSYKKLDGSIRDAVGSLSKVPEPKGGQRKVNYKVFNYFDLQQNDWRCARVENLIF